MAAERILRQTSGQGGIALPGRREYHDAVNRDLRDVSGPAILRAMLSGRFTGEWGFAAMVEIDGKRILFDTGNRPETLQNNLREMKMDLAGVPSVILTLHHRDHTGGMR